MYGAKQVEASKPGMAAPVKNIGNRGRPVHVKQNIRYKQVLPLPSDSQEKKQMEPRPCEESGKIGALDEDQAAQVVQPVQPTEKPAHTILQMMELELESPVYLERHT